jgi:hypothetical protein
MLFTRNLGICRLLATAKTNLHDDPLPFVVCALPEVKSQRNVKYSTVNNNVCITNRGSRVHNKLLPLKQKSGSSDDAWISQVINSSLSGQI